VASPTVPTPQPEVGLQPIPPGAAPVLELVVERALAALTAQTMVIACSHVDTDELPILCAAHGGSSGVLRCCDCMLDHVARHGRDVEALCDECGQIVDRIQPVVSVRSIAAVCLPCASTAGVLVTEAPTC
jgi:hypothetical protein